jgi:hypothetical protein
VQVILVDALAIFWGVMLGEEITHVCVTGVNLGREEKL